MNWLNQNSGAVQAITAMVIAFLTIILIGVTIGYAVITNRIARIGERQLATTFQPNIGLGMTNLFRGTSAQDGVDRGNISGTIIVTNNGAAPVRIVNVTMKITFIDGTFPSIEKTFDTGGRIIAPGQRIDFPHLEIEVSPGSTSHEYEQTAQLCCSDLAGVNTHNFSALAQSKDLF